MTYSTKKQRVGKKEGPVADKLGQFQWATVRAEKKAGVGIEGLVSFLEEAN